LQAYNPTTDNSNTQFAILGMWAASRHNLPVGRTLARAVHRFEASQNYDGSWGYWYGGTGRERGERSMDCVGLLALAVGHGIARAPGDQGPAPKVADPRILNGFVALSDYIGPPPVGAPRSDDPSAIDHYFLWSVERVAVLYGLDAIADKNWYQWGCYALLPNQSASGAWDRGSYHGASPTINTCFALLFLNKTNLARDLAARLPFRPAQLNKEIARKAAERPAASGAAAAGKDPFAPGGARRGGRPPGKP
jgi:hypothetical protein